MGSNDAARTLKQLITTTLRATWLINVPSWRKPKWFAAHVPVADHPVLQGKDFGCILIDEAGQTTELAVLVPLMKMRKDGVVTLVGDHRQLPPTISNVEVDVEGLGTSLFERLSSHGVEPFMLDIQYRSWLQC